ncbi:MAG: tetratricopeptide repeat protein [Candidatus Heimdallarchaeota archaeon]|nr:tetratricopeptide repeat protein [Candidatus Heimdallarchaeota archaeon]
MGLEEPDSSHGIDFDKLISQGEYDEVIVLVNEQSRPSERELLYKTLALSYKGEYSKGTPLLKVLAKSDNKIIKIEAIRQQSNYAWLSGELHESHKLAQEALRLITTLEINSDEELRVKADVIHTSGTVLWYLNDYNQAERLLTQSLDIYRELSNEVRMAASMVNLANIYENRGKPDQALSHFKSSLEIFERYGMTNNAAITISNLGEFEWDAGNMSAAIAHLETNLRIVKPLGNQFRISESLKTLVYYHVYSGDLDTAKDYYDELVEINKLTDIKSIDTLTRYAEALVLKFHMRTKYKIKAQEIFEELLEDHELIFDLRFRITLELCELLTAELVSYGEEDVLIEIEGYVNGLYEIAQANQQFLYLIDVLLLKSKLALLDSNFKAAHKLIVQAELFAAEKGLILLQSKAEKHQEDLQNDFTKWENMIREGSSLSQRLKQSHIHEYLEEVLSKQVSA